MSPKDQTPNPSEERPKPGPRPQSPSDASMASATNDPGRVRQTDQEMDVAPDLLARRFAGDTRSFWRVVWDDYKTRRVAFVALWIMGVTAVIGVLAPLLANHRPYWLFLPDDAIRGFGEKQVLEPGWQFPLFSSLRAADWVLMFGAVEALLLFLAFRFRKGKEGEVATAPALALLGFGFVPLILAPIMSPAFRGWLADRESAAPWEQGMGFFQSPTVAWALYGVLGILGALLMAQAAAWLLSDRRDEFGRSVGARAARRGFVGAMLILMLASVVGTLGRRELESVDYYEVSQREGVRAAFPPIQHDFTAAESYARNQPPGSPNTRVQISGGSRAAADLGLTDSRRDTDLSAEHRPASPTGEGASITRDTRLADLRFGEGIRISDSGADFIVIARSLETYKVDLGDAETIGEVIDRIAAETDGLITASIDPDGRRLMLDDRSEARPTHFMGTDDSGSDVTARLIHATRVALSIGFVSTGIALFIGVTVGSIMGYFGGWIDIAGMRVIEMFMAIPRLLLLLTIIAFIPPQWNDYMLYAMMAVIGATSWMGSARFIRAEFFKLRDQDFVQAARAVGLPMRSILFKHMLPNGVTPVLVDASFGVAAAIFIETGLSFLGFGIKPPNPSWGQMLSSAVDQSTGVFYWWLAIFPGIMIFLTVFGFNLIGDALRDAIDPKLKKANEA